VKILTIGIAHCKLQYMLGVTEGDFLIFYVQCAKK